MYIQICQLTTLKDKSLNRKLGFTNWTFDTESHKTIIVIKMCKVLISPFIKMVL